MICDIGLLYLLVDLKSEKEKKNLLRAVLPWITAEYRT
jgi:hypothetical protein